MHCTCSHRLDVCQVGCAASGARTLLRLHRKHRLQKKASRLQAQHVVISLPRHVLHVVDEQTGQARQAAVAVPAARAAALLNAVSGDPRAQRLKAGGEGVQLRQRREVALVTGLLEGTVCGCDDINVAWQGSSKHHLGSHV